MSKPTTRYYENTSDQTLSSVLANSTTVQANSTTVFANGFLTSTAPGQLGNKFATNFSEVVKPTTNYPRPDASLSQWLLNSAVVTLNSLTAYLNGYFTALAPNQGDNKPATAYSEVF